MRVPAADLGFLLGIFLILTGAHHLMLNLSLKYIELLRPVMKVYLFSPLAPQIFLSILLLAVFLTEGVVKSGKKLLYILGSLFWLLLYIPMHFRTVRYLENVRTIQGHIGQEEIFIQAVVFVVSSVFLTAVILLVVFRDRVKDVKTAVKNSIK